MITIRMDGLKEVLENLERKRTDQIPFALSKGINDLAFMIREKEVETIARVFDRPKPQTVRNIRVFKGNKSRPAATIAFNQIYEGDEYMTTEVRGGSRKMKKAEKKYFGRYFIPAAGAEIDAFGNMKGSQITKIISYFKLFPEVGYSMNKRSWTETKKVRKGVEYFMIKDRKRGGLVPGIYQRVQTGAGFGAKTSRSLRPGSFQKGRTVGKYSSVIRSRGVIPVVIFVDKAPTYGKRYPFYEVAQGVVDRVGALVMREAMAYAMESAR